MKIHARHYRTEKGVEFLFNGNRLVSVKPSREKTSLLYGPGFFDIQCNGFSGVDYNHPSLTPEAFRHSVHAMWRYGITHVMPTMITAPLKEMEQRMGVIAAACKKFPEIRQCVPGIHQEGPFISKVDGSRGAHPLECIVSPNLKRFDRLQKGAGGMIRMLTLAPEVKNAIPFIRSLVRRKVVVAIGHTNATPSQILQGIEAGASTSTHLGNGSAQMLPRHYNYVLAQLADDRLFASFIADGHHLPPFVLKTFFRVKPLAKRILTSDCMAAAGAPPGRYTLGRLLIEVGRDRVVRQPGKPNFAGSALTMDEGVVNASQFGGIPIEDAWDMSSIHPWSLMERSSLVPVPRFKDSFVIARHQSGKLDVKATALGGKILYRNL